MPASTPVHLTPTPGRRSNLKPIGAIDQEDSPAVFHYHWVLGPTVPAVMCSPAQLVFANQTQDEESAQTVTLTAPAASAKVLASVANDTSGGSFSAAFVKTLTITPPSGGIHSPTGAPPTKVTEQILSPTTVADASGEEIQLQVVFHAFAVPGDYTADIVVQGDGWQTLTVPVSASITKSSPVTPPGPRTSLSATVTSPLVIQQGESAWMQIVVSSLGPGDLPVQVAYTPDPSDLIGLSMESVSFALGAGQSVYQTVTFHAEADAQIGTNIPIQLWATSSDVSCAVTNATASISYGPVTVVSDAPGGARFTQNYPGTLPITISLAGSATEVTFSIGNGPLYITVDPTINTFSLGNGESLSFTLQFDVSDFVQVELRGEPMNLNWSAYGGAVTGVLQFTAYVYNAFPRQMQQESNWCWAATTVALANYYNPESGFVQCSLVGTVFAQQNAMENCCQNPAAFNFANDVAKSLSITKNLAKVFSGPPFYSNKLAPITAEYLQSQLEQGLPVAIRIQWTAGMAATDYNHPAHAIVASAWDAGGLVVIDDPFFGATAVVYSTLVNAYLGSGIWTHAYLTQAAPAQ